MHVICAFIQDMPLSAAEVARRYRERRNANSERREEYLLKERERWKKDRETGKKKGISELTERQKRAKRKKWREAKRAARAKVRTVVELQTPPPTEEIPAAAGTSQTKWRPEQIEPKHTGQWCVISYDDDAYPGIILEVEEQSVLVKCMGRNGINKFYWPSPREDINWYADQQIICFIQEPQPVNKRSLQVDRESWLYVQEILNELN